MSCGVNIPLDDLVEAIVDGYADTFAAAIIQRLDLAQFVTVERGLANDLTLRNSLTVDEAVKGDLCSILQDCIATKLQEELGCERDNHVTKFYIDKEKDHLVIELKFGERYYVSRAELEEWLRFTSSGGGIKSGKLIIQAVSPTQIIRVTNNDGSVVDIDVSALKDVKVERGEVVDGKTIRLHRSDGTQIDIDASSLTPTIPISPDSPYIVSGVFVERNGGYWLDFTRSDNSKVNVDMTDIINKIIQTVFDMVMRMGYRINTQADDYTLTGDDFNGRTIVRADKDGDQTITIPKPPSEDFVGKAIIVRKTNGIAGTFVNLVAGSDVSLLPEDATPVRRVGSSVTLVYVGNGVYDVFGELP